LSRLKQVFLSSDTVVAFCRLGIFTPITLFLSFLKFGILATFFQHVSFPKMHTNHCQDMLA